MTIQYVSALAAPASEKFSHEDLIAATISFLLPAIRPWSVVKKPVVVKMRSAYTWPSFTLAPWLSTSE
jgi:hypothetical protein